MKNKIRLLFSASFIVILLLSACTVPELLPTPEIIGDLERVKVTTGTSALEAINRLHGSDVATTLNVIAEYGGTDPKDLLYISYFDASEDAEDEFVAMMKKIANAKDGPFIHLMPIPPAEDKTFFMMGMGASHYVYLSGNQIVWFQTYQSFGLDIPQNLAALYPVGEIHPAVSI